MSIKEKLLYLVRYYNSARHCGHTNSILFGMKRNPKAMMLTIDDKGVKQLKHRIPEMDVVTISDLDKLNGLRRPLTIDNHALVYLLSEALQEIDRLEQNAKYLPVIFRRQDITLLSYDPNAYKAINVGPPPGTLDKIVGP